MLPKWLGPFAILARVGTVAYKLDLPKELKIHPVFHVSLLKLYKDGGRIQPPVPTYNAEDDGIYQVEKLLDHRINSQGKKEFLVKWAYQGEESNSWEPIANLDGSPDAITEYWQMLAMRQAFKNASSQSKRKRH